MTEGRDTKAKPGMKTKIIPKYAKIIIEKILPIQLVIKPDNLQ